MKPIDLLKGEHRVIEQVLACLTRMASRCESEGVLEVGPAKKALDFFRHFADQCHHGKEEKHLFRLLERRGFAHDQGPVGRMLYEHSVGRHYLGALAAAVEAAERDEPGAARRFAEEARSYVYWMREHIAKEDHVLFPMANHALTATDQESLLRAFEHTEAHEMGTGAHERYLQAAHELADHFGVPRAQAPGAVACACSGHR